MTFRDDHDAALARAEALQRELDAAERKLDAADGEREAMRAEIARLRAEANREPEVIEVIRPRRRVGASTGALVGVGVIVAGLAGFGVVATVSQRSSSRAPPPPPAAGLECTLRSQPSGAEAHAIHDLGVPVDPYLELVGETPLTMPALSWVAREAGGSVIGYILRMPGHRDLRVESPALDHETCRRSHHVLEPTP